MVRSMTSWPRSVGRRLAFLIPLLGCAATLAAQGNPPATPQRPEEPSPGRIRVAVDVVAVDVQVIDRTGRPVPDLGPDKFTVTINGRRRRVVSAEQVGRDTAEARATPRVGASSTVPERVIMLAVDCISFDATATRDVIQSVRAFVGRLNPDDYVGLSAYPNGAQINPTTDHAAIIRALDTIVGQRDGPGLSQFHLRPSEIVDITRDLSQRTGPTLDAVVARECGQDPSEFCRYQLLAEVTNTALYYEGQATASLGMLRTLVKQMQGYSGRKTLLLISGGMVASDSPGGRPDLGGLGIQVGKEAAIANTAIYTLFVDTSLADRYSASTRSADRTVDSRARDTAILARWLEQFSGAAGGALFNVQVANAESALARIQTELSSYYLLGVEPAEEDRDGRTHEIAVKTNQPNVTIRGRRWVMVPKSGVAAGPAASAPAPVTPSSPPPPAEAPARRVVPADVQRLADLFDHGNGDALQKALLQSPDLANTLRGFRGGDSPWPDDRKRTAVFALELALAGLRSVNANARDEGGRLLAEYHVRVRAPAEADAFECWWFLTEASALEGLFMPENALLFIPRALQRCPANGRLHLAYAFVSEQQWLRGRTTAAQEAEIARRYEDAMKFPETAAEARVRAARFFYGLGQFERGLEVLTGAAPPSTDLEVRYFTDLTRGQLLRASGRPDDAAAAFRAALTIWPGAQSARVALMTLLLNRGDREQAAALAEAAQMPPADQYDPWWTYWLGDFRAYPAFFDKLRELGR